MTRAQPEIRPIYTVVLRPEGAGPPPVMRLKRLLKCALRAFGLRAIAVSQEDGNTLPLPTDTDAE